MTRTVVAVRIIHRQNRVFRSKLGQTSKPNKMQTEHGFDVIEKDLGVDIWPVIRFQDQISSETNPLLSELLLNWRGIL
jgi:hypothetical protein